MSHGHAKTEVQAENVSIPKESAIRSLPVIGAAIALFGIITSGWLGLHDPKHFFFSYLTAFLYFLSLALGGLFFTIIQHATRAGWSVVVRRLAENVMGTLPVFALLFIPIIFGMHDLYHHWIDETVVTGDPILEGKAAYLNTTRFIAFAVLYFVIWIGISAYFRSRSLKQDESDDPSLTKRMQLWAPPAIALFALSSSFAAIDWAMTIDPHWYSTMFGVYYFAGQCVAIMALLAVMVIGLRKAGLLYGIITTEHDHDIGKLLFGFTVFWTYIAFSQYFLIWYANIPEETLFFAHRMDGEWMAVSRLLIVGHFVLPFFFLMSRHPKRIPATLLVGALWMLAMHYVDINWLIMPNHSHYEAAFGSMEIATFLLVGGVFLTALGVLMNRGPLIPVKDPRLPESLSHETF